MESLGAREEGGPSPRPESTPSPPSDSRLEDVLDSQLIRAAHVFFDRSAAIASEICIQLAQSPQPEALLRAYASVWRESELFVLNQMQISSSGSALAYHLMSLGRLSQDLRSELDGDGDPQKLGERLAAEWDAHRSMPPLMATIERQPNGRIVPYFICPDIAAFQSALTKEQFSLLSRFYSPTGPWRIAVGVPEIVLASRPQELAKINDLLFRFAGLGGNSKETLNAFGGKIPVALAPLTIDYKDGVASAYACYDNYRYPYGLLDLSLQYLAAQQNRIESGHLQKYTLELEGRVSSDFLLWAFGGGRQDAGPIPDIEILYTLPLPSGATYTFVLKEARNYTQREPNDESVWTKADWFVVNLMSEYFRNPHHRKNWELFDKIRVEDFPDALKHIAAEPGLIDTLESYQAFCREWSQSVYRQLTTLDTGPRETYKRVTWLDAEFANPAAFGKVLRERLDRVPDEQTFFAPDFLRLQPDERAKFLHAFEGKLYKLCATERDRVAHETAHGIHEQRIALGYVGPPEGFPLPLDYMIMDLIVDERRYQVFRAEQAERLHISPKEVKVPLQLGRSYWHPEWFLDSNGVVEHLKAHPPKREIVVTLDDPLVEPRYVRYPSSKIEGVNDHIDEVNIKRLTEAVNTLAIAKDAEMGTGPRQHHLEAFRAGQKVLLARVHKAEESYEQERSQRSEAMRTAAETLKEGSTKEYRQRLHEFRKPFDLGVETQLNLLRQERKQLLQYYQEGWPGGVSRYGIKLSSIVDRQMATYIFSIGAEGKPIYAPNHVGFKRTHSEALQGKNMYAGGEVTFAAHDVSLHSLAAWKSFDQNLRERPAPLPLKLTEISDGSGHYEPLPATLIYASNIITPQLQALGIQTDGVKLRDGLAPFLRMRGLTYDFGRLRDAQGI